jgi:hypothetical protein
MFQHSMFVINNSELALKQRLCAVHLLQGAKHTEDGLLLELAFREQMDGEKK